MKTVIGGMAGLSVTASLKTMANQIRSDSFQNWGTLPTLPDQELVFLK